MERRTSEPAPASDDAANTNGVLFWPVVTLVVLADLITKAIGAYALAPAGFPHALAGNWLRLTLIYNQGAAFGLHLGPWSRGIFLALTLVVLRVIWRLYRMTADRDNRRVFALALLAAGAIGNALTRLISDDGVVDFLDIGVGAHRWPTFNLADVAVTAGALLLFRILWRADDSRAPATRTSDGALHTTPAELA